MDKLEKALLKAREQRKSSLCGDVRQRAPLLSENASLPPADVKLSEDILEDNRVVAHRPKDANADIFKLLRSQVLQTMGKNGLKTIAVTSPNYEDGKTTIAINLSLSIALDLNQTVLLADLDLRKPSIHKYLGLQAQLGLTDYLRGGAGITDCLVRLPFDRLTILPVGKSMERSSETLGSPQMGRVAEEFKSRYADRIVIYDMPPLLAQDDPLAFLPHVDGVLLVIRDGITRTDDIKRCLDILGNAKIVGIVLNDSFV